MQNSLLKFEGIHPMKAAFPDDARAGERSDAESR
jgi:hypothetical protein